MVPVPMPVPSPDDVAPQVVPTSYGCHRPTENYIKFPDPRAITIFGQSAHRTKKMAYIGYVWVWWAGGVGWG